MFASDQSCRKSGVRPLLRKCFLLHNFRREFYAYYFFTILVHEFPHNVNAQLKIEEVLYQITIRAELE